MVAADCSMGGYQLRKCASKKRPPVKKAPKRKAATAVRKAAKKVSEEEEENTPEAQGADAPGTQKITRSGKPYGGKGLTYGTEKIGGKMPTVPLQGLSPHQMSKLRNGGAVRVSLGSGSDGDCSCAMKEGTLKKVMKNKRGKTTIKLDPEEIAENKISGTGIMKGSRGGPKHGGIRAGTTKRKVIDLIEDIGEDKPRKTGESRVRQAIDLVETMRRPKGKGSHTRISKGTGVSQATPAMWQNALDNLDKAVREDDEKAADKYEKILADYTRRTEEYMKKVKDKPSKSGGSSLLKVFAALEKGAKMFPDAKDAIEPFAKNVYDAIKYIYAKLGLKMPPIPGAMGSGVGYGSHAKGEGITYGGHGYYGLGADSKGGHGYYGLGVGGAIGRTATKSGITNIGAGGNILGPMQASKAPQAASQNFFFHTQFPPAMAAQIMGGSIDY